MLFKYVALVCNECLPSIVNFCLNFMMTVSLFFVKSPKSHIAILVGDPCSLECGDNFLGHENEVLNFLFLSFFSWMDWK